MIESREYTLEQESPLEPVTLTNKQDGRVTVLPVDLVDELCHDGEFLGDRQEAKFARVSDKMLDDDPWPRPPWMCNDD